MNKRILKIIHIAEISLFLTSAFSQIGIKGGLGISDIAFKEYGQTPYLGYEINSFERRAPMLSFQVGSFSTVGLWKRLEFQPELLFAMQGLNYNCGIFIFSNKVNQSVYPGGRIYELARYQSSGL